RDVARLFFVVQKRREVHVADREVAARRVSRGGKIGRERPRQRSGRRPNVYGDAEAIERSAEADLERRLQLDALKRRHERRELRNGRFVRRDLQLQNRRRQILFDRALDRQRGLGRANRDLLEKQRIVADRQRTAERVERKL